ncbi:MAG: type I glyceraldehyde-3-phosphate dehydrogenase [Alphaproteobacteria bacterium RIFCSPHIGHO2_01_FULL_41_14]|nr:MAG: type I glyceraldehyde-3-phosphate dehydrogenase [Alphaproteobacteria bacterium GWB1_45_5]OFW76127.1 MAG: type I glyceraldehyde-3-phosphate dehydrogenase [Alphaproteobacteria bacterium GWA1_45_9]OFW89583.1 MAG: type I glyceraldehyde-3-phosphate dehydrogenase [Alphaproteobacteria bacterium RIFCSPHIGHO2_01_FULL_41_14]
MKKVRVAINGFGRIGRLVLRAIYESKRTDIDVVAINDLTDVRTNAHLLKFDSVHGVFPFEVTHDDTSLLIEGHRVAVFSEADPLRLPWTEYDVDILMECSGHFTERDKAALHLQAGAKKVLISAPAKGEDCTVVYGVNHKALKASDKIVSNASCTTNCLAPVASVLDEAVGIEKGYMTTIHAYTGDQRLVDTAHKDLHRARAAALSMIPTSTGAAKAVGLVLPHLKGKLDGTAIRVPIPNVSVVDFKFVSEKNTTAQYLNEAIQKAVSGHLKGILDFVTLPLVSIDFNHNPHSSLFDANQTHVVKGNLCRVLAWYDNEWGFSNRMSDTAVHMAQLGYK